MKFSLFLLLCIATCLESVLAAEAQKAHLASVMMNTTGLHKCDAFFVTKGGEGKVTQGRTLVTTASCVFSAEHQLIIGVGDKIVGQDAFYNVEEVFIHPNYSKNPDLYNIAVMHIEKPAKDVLVYELVNSTDYYGVTGSLHLWRFVDKKYELTKESVTYVTEEFYERATNVRLRESELAVMSAAPITNGPYDVGTPFTVESSENGMRDLRKDTNYALGFLVKPQLESKGKFFALYSIPFYYSWITGQLKYDD